MAFLKRKESDLLRVAMTAPEGMKPENIILTTFTLSTGILADIILKYVEATGKIEDIMSLDETELYLLLAEHLDIVENNKIHIFSDDYLLPAFDAPPKLNRLIERYLIANMVTVIAPKNQESYFHPKLIITEFGDGRKSERKFYRVIISSKNLTYSDMLETYHVFESCSEGQECECEYLGKKIADFFESIRNLDLEKDLRPVCGINKPIKDACTEIKGLLDSILKQKFKLCVSAGEPVPEKVDVYFSTPNDQKMKDKFEDDIKESKEFFWCSDSISKRFIENYYCPMMISNIRSWLRAFKDCMASESFKVPDYAFKLMSDESLSSNQMVHAKFAEINQYERYILWNGSANFTENAFTKNYECDVRCEYKREDIGKKFSVKLKKYAVEPYHAEELSLIDLQKEETQSEFEKYIKELKWTVVYDEINKTLKVKAEGLKLNTVDNKEVEKWVSSLIIVLPSGMNAEVEVKDKTNDRISYFSQFDGISKLKVPWYGVVNILYFPHFNGPKSIPIRVKIQSPDGSEIDSQQEMQEILVKIEGAKNLALANSIFRFRNVIPPEPKGGTVLYLTGDSFGNRLAKYYAKGGSEDALKQRANMILEKLKLGEYSKDDDYTEEEFIEYHMEDGEIEELKQRLKNLLGEK